MNTHSQKPQDMQLTWGVFINFLWLESMVCADYLIRTTPHQDNTPPCVCVSRYACEIVC